MEETLIKRVMPNSLEAEQSVIGSMIMDQDAIVTAMEILLQEDFYHKQYGILFDAMIELYSSGQPVDLVFLIAAPNTEDNIHLDVLSKLSVLLMNEEFTEALRNAETVEEFMGIINDADEKEAGIDDVGLCTDEKIHTMLAMVHTYPDGDRDFSFYRNPGADMMLNKTEIPEDILKETEMQISKKL